LALLTVLVTALATAGSASPRPLTGPFSLPAGSTATFTSPTLGGCNSLTGSYQLDGGQFVELVSKPYVCEQTYTGSDVTIGPFTADHSLLVVLNDNSCEMSYYSDGTPVDHVIVDGSNPYTVRFADAGGDCERRNVDFNDFDGGNFIVGLTITAPTVTLAPPDTSIRTGATQTETASVTLGGQPLAGEDVTFTVIDGPNAGVTGHATTGADGSASFSYSSSSTGTDHVQASFTDVGGRGHTSNVASVNWVPPPRADVSVSVSGPTVARVGEKLTFTSSVANGGPDTATGVVLRAPVPAGLTLVSATTSTGNGCDGTTCAIGTLASGASATVTYAFTATQAGTPALSASVASDWDPNGGNNASSAAVQVVADNAPPPAPPPPTQPGTFNAIDSGTVLVNGVQRPADQLFQLSSGDTIDVTDGVLAFTAADGSTGLFSSSQQPPRRGLSSASADDLPAQFTVSQPTAGGPTTLTLVGADFAACGSSRTLSAKSQTPIRQLWGSAKGNFTTKGRFAAATVRGTIWLVQDRCDGTLTQVVEGVVDVADQTTGKTVSVAAGQSYVALAPPPPLRVPAGTHSQTAAQVRRRGLVWGGRVYRTKAAFTKFLTANGNTWAQFAHAYPKLAAALAKRT
jgi:uncharacterized repeat protein (TIGR01451 family)